MTHEQGNTQTPWKFSPAHIEEGPSVVRAPEGYIVCTTASDADAKLIVTAVNERATLLSQVRQKDSALEHAKQVLSGVVPIDHEDEDKDGDSKACQAAIASINAALSPALQPDAAPADQRFLSQAEQEVFDNALRASVKDVSPLPADDVVEAAHKVAQKTAMRWWHGFDHSEDEILEDNVRELANDIVAAIAVNLLRQSAPVEAKPNPHAGWKVPPYYNGEHDQGMGVPEKCKCGNSLRLKPLGWECEKCRCNYGR